MSRVCTVCVHAQRKDIDLALAGGASNRAIARQWSVTKDAIARHKADHLPKTLTNGIQVAEVVHARNVRAELEKAFHRTNLVLDACHDWLQDPDAPEKYTLDPCAEDLRVTYLDDADPPKRRKATLAELLERVRGIATGIRVESRHSDRAELVLTAVARLRPLIELLARLLGELGPNAQVNVAVVQPNRDEGALAWATRDELRTMHDIMAACEARRRQGEPKKQLGLKERMAVTESRKALPAPTAPAVIEIDPGRGIDSMLSPDYNPFS